MLGIREPEVYGSQIFEDYFLGLKEEFTSLDLSYEQTNAEHEIIDLLHKSHNKTDAIILNAGAFTHTSLAIADAIRSISTPVVEVHISNTFARESFRHHSYLSPVCKGVICGFGFQSYNLAIQYFLSLKK